MTGREIKHNKTQKKKKKSMWASLGCQLPVAILIMGFDAYVGALKLEYMSIVSLRQQKCAVIQSGDLICCGVVSRCIEDNKDTHILSPFDLFVIKALAVRSA